ASAGEGKILKPGQAYQDGVVIKTDIAQDIAWKKGIFNFHGKNVEEVMRQLSRWYDIEVSYASKPPAIIFYGEMGRNLTLSKVLEFLEKSGVKFRLEGNKLKVLN
ncbi:MAG: DUF4974 domain-containing protein, partial [Chitinophagaceae bacterium]|nr:DUF4974 domain-containing protein [Chitinophagaceae bacterium]